MKHTATAASAPRDQTHFAPIFSGAAELAEAIRARRISASEALEAHLDRIDARNPTLNAIVTIDAEAARKRAREADAALARGENFGPLHGVPFTLKDAHLTAGMRTTVGFPPFAGHVPAEDGAVAARLKQAGGILIGKTNVPVLMADWQTDNPIFGRTNNPWDHARTPGGSSGGAAAAIAAGMTPFDIGTDLAASIRVPAHFCGVHGLKPTEGRVSSAGLVPNPDGLPRGIRAMVSIGPMARTVEDLALLHGVIAGPDGIDSEVPPVPIGDTSISPASGLRIAFARTFPGLPVTKEVADAVEELARRFATAGAAVEEARLPEIDFHDDLKQAGELISMMTGVMTPDGPPATLKDHAMALDRRDHSIAAWEAFFQRWDGLVCPASATAAFPHCEPWTPIEVDGAGVDYRMIGAHGTVFNYTGHPAVVLPVTVSRDGMPIDVQIVGKRWSEGRLLGIARLAEAMGAGFRRPPGY